MKRKIVFYSSLTVLIITAALLVLYLVRPYIQNKKPDVTQSSISSSQEGTSSIEDTRVENPIDFAFLQARNPDAYAWIRIPGTDVDYPVLQSTENAEDFYLNHNLDKQYEFAGSIYTQRLNGKDFKDPNTVLYGHNMLNGSMFASLLDYRDPAFFEENKYIYIYMPDRILTYTVYAAYRYDNRHLLFAFNYSDRDTFQSYLDSTLTPHSTIVNVRDGITLTADDRIITLSTCITNDNYRYLVQGVLTDEQFTK